MSRVIYFDCFSGASGDMLLGAIVDCGVPIDALAAELQSVPVGGYRLTTNRVQRAGIAATKVDVLLDEADAPHRRLSDLLSIVAASRLPEADQEKATRVFTALATAEASVHGVDIEAIEFHEVGAVDAIVDVLGTIAGLRLLGVSGCFVSPLAVGSGAVMAAHGTLPVPGPATLALLAQAGAPVAAPLAGERHELLTPTGAALLTTLGRFERPALRLERVGYGAGGRDTPGRPNVLRAWLGDQQAESIAVRAMVIVETNIDDMNPELYGWVLERLFAAGAADAWCTPIQMKKNRPSVTLQALCSIEAQPAVIDLFLRETSTLGVRVHRVERYEAPRSSVRFRSTLGEVRLKVKQLAGELPRYAPEFDDCRALALASGLPLMEIYRIVEEARGLSL